MNDLISTPGYVCNVSCEYTRPLGSQSSEPENYVMSIYPSLFLGVCLSNCL